METQTREQLLAECHRLLNEVAKRPNNMKLLLGVKHQLEMFSQYKANRNGNTTTSRTRSSHGNRTEQATCRDGDRCSEP